MEETVSDFNSKVNGYFLNAQESLKFVMAQFSWNWQVQLIHKFTSQRNNK